ncbi:MAG TPA: hypothetical protein PK816_17725 [Candidatus Cloacimonadota bacterium]|nr:hypothetical protein [Candidatus Cloacimonadota bacterium]
MINLTYVKDSKLGLFITLRDNKKYKYQMYNLLKVMLAFERK